MKTMGMGCAQATADAIPRLRNSWSLNRRNTADAIRHNGGPWEAAVPALLDAVSRENDPQALGAELIALGASGSRDAAAPICLYLRSASPDIKRWARKAFYLWLPQNPDRPMCSEAEKR
ncbi:MAG: hypothetical protein ABI461_09460 [Polyangiaceae bacterium]